MSLTPQQARHALNDLHVWSLRRKLERAENHLLVWFLLTLALEVAACIASADIRVMWLCIITGTVAFLVSLLWLRRAHAAQRELHALGMH